MLRSNRVTWLAGLTVIVAFGTLFYATGGLDYGTYILQGRLKNPSSNLNSTIPPKIPPHCVPVADDHVEQWDSSRFLIGRPTKSFRGVAYSICGGRGMLFNRESMQTIFSKINLISPAGRLLGSVRSFFGNLFGMGNNFYPTSEPVHGLCALLLYH